jgi:hypothetical protein
MKYIIAHPYICGAHSQFGDVVISKMDEFKHVIIDKEKIGSYHITDKYITEFNYLTDITLIIANIYREIGIGNGANFYNKLGTTHRKLTAAMKAFQNA